MEIQPGLVGEVEIVVQAADTADALGNKGVHVLATPRLIGLIEDAGIRAVQPHLPAGAGTVGTRLDVKHLAATPVGMRVRARAVLREVDGRRYLYDVEAHDEVEKVAEGTHERFQINQARFLERVAEKAQRKGGR
jgi:fluoroacetyl-CoA thioesterase